jgi:hypothetical protein
MNPLQNPDIESIRKDERQNVLDELWDFCLKNGAVEHGNLVGLPQDTFFPLKLVKKIAEMRKSLEET